MQEKASHPSGETRKLMRQKAVFHCSARSTRWGDARLATLNEAMLGTNEDNGFGAEWLVQGSDVPICYRYRCANRD
jgi:hypothetical protein